MDEVHQLKRPESSGTSVVPIRATPPPAMSCFICFVHTGVLGRCGPISKETDTPCFHMGTGYIFTRAMRGRPLRAAWPYSCKG